MNSGIDIIFELATYWNLFERTETVGATIPSLHLSLLSQAMSSFVLSWGIPLAVSSSSDSSSEL